MKLSLRDTPRLYGEGTCICCGEGESDKRGHLVYIDGAWIHYARCLNRAYAPQPIAKEDRVEQATAAPGEVRDVEIPKKKRQPKRPQSLPRDL